MKSQLVLRLAGSISVLIAIDVPFYAVERPATVAAWGFGTEETSRLTPYGKLQQEQPGPRPPEFPDFDSQNTAVKLDGDGAHFAMEDAGLNSPFDFTNGDSITLEAWVHVESIGSNDFRYVVGKGRTGAKGFAKDNQNWAMRVSGRSGLVHANFLFATEFAPDQTTSDAHWHRWTTTDGFLPGSGWHHLAVTYQFGKPETIRAWLDGKPRDGAWDMGGATTQAPVVDDDAVWIGSSQKGSPGNSFLGLIDEVAIHRSILSDEILRSRFRREGPERAEPQIVETRPEVPHAKVGQVLFRYFEDLPTHDRWAKAPDESHLPIVQWEFDTLIMPRLPYRYDDWGIREGWKPPVLVQATTDIALPAGRHRLLVRARGLSRLWLDEKIVVRTKPHSGSSDGHEPVQSVPDLPATGHRQVGFGDQEVIEELVIDENRDYRLIFEAIIGGKKLRAEPGEMLVAIQLEGSNKFELLTAANSHARQQSLLEDEFAISMKRANDSLTLLDDQLRRDLSSKQNDFWNRRHELGRKWVDSQSESKHPTPNASIDAFIHEKIARAKSTSTGEKVEEAKNFHDKVLPVLRENCFRCHGDKVKGGLRLNTLSFAKTGGDSGEPALVEHDPKQSPIIQRIRERDEGQRMPSGSEPLSEKEVAILEDWIEDGALWPDPIVTDDEIAIAPIVDDPSFLRRVYLDTVGVPPREEDAREFLSDTSADKRTKLILRLLRDERLADHWVSYWQDVLAENPNMLKPSLNNTGPFRFFIYEALRDNKPFDRMVTELIMMRGSEREGGSAGFGLAADNDAPFASKGHILAGAFLGVEMQCARCHDAPFHSSKQQDLFSLAAMLSRKPITVPPTSTVAPGFFEKNKGRDSLIEVTLKPGVPVKPEWPFADSIRTLEANAIDEYVQDRDDSRERLAALFTSPQNERFSQVIVNRVWKRLIGAGFVEPAHDWEGRVVSHPELLAWLGQDFVDHGYDFRHLVHRILTSQIYQRVSLGNNLDAAAERRFFNAPDRRRLTAEQVADSLFASSGQPMEVEEITFDPDGRRPASSMTNLGAPSRAWMFASLSNERDRPSLSLPKAQLVSDILEAFGWTGTRQNPRTDRETDPNVLQPGVLSNSPIISSISRASIRSPLADLAVETSSPSQLVDSLFLRFLARNPTPEERTLYESVLKNGFGDRIVPVEERYQLPALPRLARVSWSNHLVPEANSIKLEVERRAREGSPYDPRLKNDWRMVYEDVVWSIINSPEFVWVP